MFRAILWTQWKWLRLFILVGSVGLFALPIFSVWNFSDPDADRWRVESLLSTMQLISVFYALFAALAGLLIAAGSWQFDLRGKHVYALSLPIPRWHYVLLRFAAGTLLLLVPAAFVYAGATSAVASASIPLGLHGYPLMLALRFLLASFLVYGVVFAMTALPPRLVTGVAIGLGALMIIDLLFAGAGRPLFIYTSLSEIFVKDLGFFDVFIGRWMLIDV